MEKKTRKTGLLAKPNKVIKERLISPEVRDLTNYLISKDAISEAHIGRGSREGTFYKKTREAVIRGKSTSDRDVVTMHEDSHALKRTGEGKYAKWMDKYKKLSWLDKIGLVMPKHWVEGKVGNPDLRYPRDPYSQKTLSTLLDQVENAIPKGGNWSGIKSAQDRPKGGRHAYWDIYPEALAYGRTETKVKQLDPSLYGMYLLDYGVPMDIAEGAVKALRLAKPK